MYMYNAIADHSLNAVAVRKIQQRSPFRHHQRVQCLSLRSPKTSDDIERLRIGCAFPKIYQTTMHRHGDGIATGRIYCRDRMLGVDGSTGSLLRGAVRRGRPGAGGATLLLRLLRLLGGVGEPSNEINYCGDGADGALTRAPSPLPAGLHAVRGEDLCNGRMRPDARPPLRAPTCCTRRDNPPSGRGRSDC